MLLEEGRWRGGGDGDGDVGRRKRAGLVQLLRDFGGEIERSRGKVWGLNGGINCRLFVVVVMVLWQPNDARAARPCLHTEYACNGVSVPSDSPVFLHVLRCATRNCRRAEPFRTLKRFTETKKLYLRSYM